MRRRWFCAGGLRGCVVVFLFVCPRYVCCGFLFVSRVAPRSSILENPVAELVLCVFIFCFRKPRWSPLSADQFEALFLRARGRNDPRLYIFCIIQRGREIRGSLLLLPAPLFFFVFFSSARRTFATST